MVKKPKVYDIDNVLRGYNDYNKLRGIYKDLRSEVMTGDPVQVSCSNLVTISHTHRGSQYGWKLFSVDESVVMLEYFGDWRGYAHEAMDAPALTDAHLHRIRLTIHKSNRSLEEAVKKIIARYPRKEQSITLSSS